MIGQRTPKNSLDPVRQGLRDPGGHGEREERWRGGCSFSHPGLALAAPNFKGKSRCLVAWPTAQAQFPASAAQHTNGTIVVGEQLDERCGALSFLFSPSQIPEPASSNQALIGRPGGFARGLFGLLLYFFLFFLLGGRCHRDSI